MKRFKYHCTVASSCIMLSVGLSACGADSSRPVDQTAGPLRGAPGAAADEPHGPDHHLLRMIEHLDADKDGTLEVSELPAHLKHHLGDADADRDGVLTKEELTSRRPARGDEHFARTDTNRDGALTESEVGGHWQHLVAADADGDGKVTKAELEAAHQNGRLHRGGPGGRGHSH